MAAERRDPPPRDGVGFVTHRELWQEETRKRLEMAAERDAAVARAEAAEAQTREWRHKYDVLVREHDAATTELAEAAAAVDRVRAQIWSYDDSDEVQAGVIFRALDGGAT